MPYAGVGDLRVVEIQELQTWKLAKVSQAVVSNPGGIQIQQPETGKRREVRSTLITDRCPT